MEKIDKKVSLNLEVTEKATRRRFSVEYKERIATEAQQCQRPGELGALLRREGLHSTTLNRWRRYCLSWEPNNDWLGTWGESFSVHRTNKYATRFRWPQRDGRITDAAGSAVGSSVCVSQKGTEAPSVALVIRWLMDVKVPVVHRPQC